MLECSFHFCCERCCDIIFRAPIAVSVCSASVSIGIQDLFTDLTDGSSANTNAGDDPLEKARIVNGLEAHDKDEPFK